MTACPVAEVVKVTLVHNPSAGADGPDRDELTKLFAEAGYTVRYCDIGSWLATTLGEPTDLVVIAGGDGTVSSVLERADIRVPIVLLPLGSANNIASALGHMRPIDEVIASLGATVACRFDIGIAEGPWGRRRFIEGVGFGPLALALAACEATGVEGHRSVHFGRATLRDLLHEAEPMRFQLRLDDHTWVDDFAMIEVLNISQIGPRLRLAPSADPSDRLLDVFCVPFRERSKMLSWLDEPDASPPPFTTHQVKLATFVSEGLVPTHIDDEFPERATLGSVDVKIGIEDVSVTVLRR